MVLGGGCLDGCPGVKLSWVLEWMVYLTGLLQAHVFLLLVGESVLSRV